MYSTLWIEVICLSLHISYSSAQCGFSYGLCDYGGCNSDPNAVDYLQTCLFPSSQGICEDVVNVTVVVDYTGLDAVHSTVTAINPATSLASSAYYFDFNVPMSAILADSVVFYKDIYNDAGEIVTFQNSFTLHHTPTITVATTSTTATSVVVASTTTTSTYTDVQTSTVTPAPVIATTITGYKTVTAPKPTITSTLTITPRGCTRTVNTIVYTTTTISCLGPAKGKRNAGPTPLAGLQNRQAGIPSVLYNTPVCNAPLTTTTVSTYTAVFTTTSTTTATDTALTVVTSTSTVILAPSTSFISVKGTTTTTPPAKTVTRTTVAPVPPPVTVTHTISITRTKLTSTLKNGLPPACSTAKIIPVSAPAGAPVNQKIVTK